MVLDDRQNVRTGKRRFGSAVVSVVAALVASSGMTAVASASPTARATTSAAGAAATFTATTPKRVLDTRIREGASAPAGRGTVHLKVTGQAGVPTTGVTAVVLTLTATAAAANGYVTAYADGTSRPTASSLDFRAARTIAAQVYAPVGSDGSVALYNGSTGTTQLVADVQGFFVEAPSDIGGEFVSTTPTRVLDTRRSLGASTPAGRGTVHLQILGAGSVPTSGISAVVMTLTATAATAPGYVSAYPDGSARPGTSNVNFGTGTTVANLVIMPVGDDGKIALYNGSAGSTFLVGDVTGYFLAGSDDATGTYVPTTPTRVTSGVVLRAGDRHVVDFSAAGMHSGPVESVVSNLTATASTRSGYLSTFDGTSAVDFAAGETVADTDAIANSGPPATPSGVVHNGSAGTTRLYVDVFGFYSGLPGGISGRVTDSANGAGVSDVIVDVYDGDVFEAEETGTLYGTATTGADGSYRIDNLAIGSYTVCFDPRQLIANNAFTGYVAECYKAQRPWFGTPDILPDGLQPVPVNQVGITSGIDASLVRVPTGTVSGRVTRPNGAGDANADVRIDNEDYRTFVHADADGSYVAQALPAGTYDVCLGIGEPVSPDGPYGFADYCRTVVVTSGQVTQVSGQLVALGAVSGTVTAGSGGPVEFGTVHVYDTAGNEVDFAYVDPSTGKYVISNLAPRQYLVCFQGFKQSQDGPFLADQCYDDVVATPTGRPTAQAHDVAVTAARETTGISAVLSAAGAVSGEATSAGMPLADVSVSVLDGSGDLITTARTGTDGTYAISGLTPYPAGYVVCFDGRNLGGSGTNYATECWQDQPWSGNAGQIPAGATRVKIAPGQTQTGIDEVLARTE